MGDENSDGERPFSIFEELHQPFLLWWNNPEKEFFNKMLRRDLEKAVDGLPESYRVVVVLAEMEDLSYREIAGILQLPVGTVRSRLHKRQPRRPMKTIGCEEALHQLLEYLDEELGTAKSRQVEYHLTLCRSCFSRAEFERRLKEKLLEAGKESARDALKKRIKTMISRF
jgi:anti-sigma factor (TIGR02949 family)